MAKAIPEDLSHLGDPDDIKSQIREYVKLKASMDILEERSKELRVKLFAELDSEGYEDDKGNLLLELEEPIDGVTRLEKQRRTKRSLDELRAEELLEELGLKDEVYDLKPVLNEDSLMGAFYEGKITESQLEEIFPLQITWALRTVKK